MKLILFTLYKYYSKGVTKDVAYVKSVGIILLMLLINGIAVAKVFNGNIPYHLGNKYLNMLVYFGLGYLIFWLLFKEKDLLQTKYDEKLVKRTGRAIICYVILSLIVMVITIKL